MSRRPPRRRVLLAELERRGVFRMSAVYGSVAFLLLEGLRLSGPALRISSPWPQMAALLALAGYPVALWLAWHYELSGEGLDRTDAASSGELRDRTGMPRIRRWAPTLLGAIGVLLLTGATAQIFLG